MAAIDHLEERIKLLKEEMNELERTMEIFQTKCEVPTALILRQDANIRESEAILKSLNHRVELALTTIPKIENSIAIKLHGYFRARLIKEQRELKILISNSIKKLKEEKKKTIKDIENERRDNINKMREYVKRSKKWKDLN